MNHIVIKGRLTADPEAKVTQNGTGFTRFTVAVDRPYKNGEGQREADFFRCTAWRERGDFIQKYFAKGREILVEGSMQSRTYDAQDGSKRTSWELMVNRVEFCGSEAGGRDSGSTADATQADPNGFVETDDELPF